ncbi:MAG: 2-C-methyl-D-erythritol 2,4-cyclodiphosphate synthase [Burkholderiales bacterium]|jgi:2-C-methyl-D-erythritol 2,4-cyclodiphosphate synthase|nr:2-C-methyl-D-erythritol 2,4-cyclodiphosphate synthase [Burkholderiales bacterium]
MQRIGQGFDLHRLMVGRKLILGGVEIPFHKGLDGHSDADVLIHAIIDAMIGAAALGDIGRLFPDTDKQYKDINSRELLKIINAKINSDYLYKINNIDSTIILEEPKLSGYIEQMRQNLAQDLDIDLDQINIKAKTSEKVGIVGRGEAAIAEAVVLLIR